MKPASFQKKISLNIVWSLFQKFGAQVIMLGGTIILSRLLSPSEYGLVAMVMIFYGMYEILIDGGFGAAIIQNKEIDQDDLSTVFWFNIIIGILLTIIGFACSGLIAEFYNNSELVDIARLLSVLFIISSLSIVQKMLFQKNIDFKTLAIITICAVLVSRIVAVIAALNNYGVYSLIIQNILNVTISGCLMWIFSDWKPKFIVKYSSLKKLWNFSSYMFGHRIATYAFNRVDELIIGKYFQVAELGLYKNAKKIIHDTVQSIAIAVSNVLFPSLSEIQNDTEKLRGLYKRTVANISLLVFAGLGVVLGLSDSFLIPLLGQKWEGIVILFQLFGCISSFKFLNIISQSFVFAKGNSKLVFNFGMYLKVFRTILIVILVFPYGVLGILYAIVLSELVFFFVLQNAILKYFQLDIYNELKPSVIAFILGAGLFFINFYGLEYFHFNVFLEIALLLITSMLIVFIYGKLFLKEPFNDIIGLIKLSPVFKSKN